MDCFDFSCCYAAAAAAAADNAGVMD